MKQDIDVVKLAREKFPETIRLDGLDKAIIGLNIRVNGYSNFIYSVNKLIRILMERDKMSWDGAIDFYEYNIKPLDNIDKKGSPMFFDDRPHHSLN